MLVGGRQRRGARLAVCGEETPRKAGELGGEVRAGLAPGCVCAGGWATPPRSPVRNRTVHPAAAVSISG